MILILLLITNLPLAIKSVDVTVAVHNSNKYNLDIKKIFIYIAMFILTFE